MASSSERIIVEQIVAAAPSGATLPPRDVLAWKKNPGVQDLCKTVQRSDLPALFCLMNLADWPVANLATSLLRSFKDDPEVRKQYLEIWSNKDRPLEVRLCVMYPLLDYPDLEQALHKQFFATIMENLAMFKAFALTYFPTPADVLPTAISRIVDPKHPPSKRWIYLCNALASPDQDRAIDFISLHTNDSDNFMADVAKAALAESVGVKSK